MKKVKHINFKFEIVGNGIVNYDSKDQKYLWNRESKNGNKTSFSSIDNNNMYSKKVYMRDSEGNLNYKIKISSDALKNAIFKYDVIATNPSIQHNKVLVNSFIGSPLGIIRGYMFAGNNTITRKSPLTITQVIQNNNSVSYMEFHSRSGYKGVNGDEGSTTLYNKETIGDVTYVGEGCIDLMGMEFLSCDPIFDRYQFNADDYDTYLRLFLSKSLPNFNSELGYYKLITSFVNMSEYGIKLSNENKLFLVKETLKRIMGINIRRSGAYAKINKLEIELVYDPLDTKNNEFIEIKTLDDINQLNFDMMEFYELTDSLEQVTLRNDILNKEKEKSEIKAENKKKNSKKVSNGE